MDMTSRMIVAAETRQQELLTLVATMRRVADSEPTRSARPSVGLAIRQGLGSALIMLGTRLQTGMTTGSGSLTLRSAH